jgi:glucokinase
MAEFVFAGVDVGGTNIKVGIIDDEGKVLASTSFATRQELGPQHAVERSAKAIKHLAADLPQGKVRLVAVGLGTPGPMDIPAGLILSPGNLPAWRNFPIRDALAKATGFPVTFANDANAAAFGEYWIGRGAKLESIALITLGTGVGGGIIVNGMSIDGAHSHGSEVGHVRVDSRSDARICPCGQRGHLEAYASATAVVARATERMPHNRSSLLHGLMSDAEPLSAIKVARAAEEHDALAISIIDETAWYLGDGIAILGHVIDPNAVIIGGAMDFGGKSSVVGRRFLAEIRARVQDCTFPIVAEKLTIDFATLGSSAGFIGAAGLARKEFTK